MSTTTPRPTTFPPTTTRTAAAGAAAPRTVSRRPSARSRPRPGRPSRPDAPPVRRRAADPAWEPAAYTKTPLPSLSDLSLLNRFTAGWTPALQREVDAAGGFDTWFARQLALTSSDSWADTTLSWWPALSYDPATIGKRHHDQVEFLGLAMQNYQRWTLVRRLGSQRQVLDVVTDMWENHFNVPANSENWCAWRPDFGRTVRKMALGKFTDLLYTVTTHPAMGVYLGNAFSTKAHPNENLGRELLELHTVGRDPKTGAPPYTEAEVIDAARILTGWRATVWDSWTATYQPGDHWTGSVSVLGFTDANTDPDGRALTRRFTDHLARHPLTAKAIARRIARRFYADTPSDAIVEKLAKTYLDNDTAIIPVLQALVADKTFRDAATTGFAGTTKVRTPDEDLLATWRALGATPSKPSSSNSAANQILWQSSDIGYMPYSWPSPDGRPDVAGPWSSSARFLGSASTHYMLAGGWWPTQDNSFRPASSWVPEDQMPFDQLIDHLSRSLLGLPSTPAMLQACCRVIGVNRTDKVGRTSGFIYGNLPRVITTVLDGPATFTR